MDMQEKLLNGEEVVRVARGWIGTRFHHQGRRKASGTDRGGCDCLGLLVGVARELQLSARNGQLLAQFDERDYGHMPDGLHFSFTLENILQQIDKEEIFIGDVMLMQIDGSPRHVAIVSDYAAGGFGIIHALAAARKVVEHRLDTQWEKRVVAAYRLPQLI